ncbi:MAG: glycosyltransferase [Candidatus Sumerlaeia bacterium]
MPVFSVIIPTYNRAALVREAVASVLSQTFQDFELIVVDDGSTDKTPSVLKQIEDPRLSMLVQPRSGPSAARNAGARRAKGRWLAFLDSDDLWLPEKLAAQARWFAENPGIAICQTEEIWLRDGRPVHPKLRHRKEGGWIFPRALDLCLVSPSAVAMESTLFHESGGFDESLPACEDYDLWLRLLHDRSIGLIETPLVIKRAGAWPQLSREVPALDRYRIRAIGRLLESGVLTPANRELAIAALRRKCEIYIKGCLKRGKSREAAEYERLMKRYGGDNRVEMR